MALDLAAELVQALRSLAGREALSEALRPIIAGELRAVLAEQQQQLEPLATVLGCSVRAAAARLRRDVGLRALGVPVGRGRLLFRRTDVQSFMRQREQHGSPMLRSVGDAG